MDQVVQQQCGWHSPALAPLQETLWKGGFGLSDSSFLTAQLAQSRPTTKAPLSKSALPELIGVGSRIVSVSNHNLQKLDKLPLPWR